LTLIVFKDMTSLIQFKEVKVENHFFELLTSALSHEMRTPLNATLGFIYNNKGKRLLNIIQNSAKVLLFLVNDMQDVF
jgi:signal transduction histidine kinase